VNTYLPTTPIPKPPAPFYSHFWNSLAPTWNWTLKPVIRVPARRQGHAHTSHSAYGLRHRESCNTFATVTFHSHYSVSCGQFVPISDTCNSVFFPLHHTFGTFISHFISCPLSFPCSLFSRFMFCRWWGHRLEGGGTWVVAWGCQGSHSGVGGPWFHLASDSACL